MKIWIDIEKPRPDETYTHSVTNNEDAKRLIIECERKGGNIRAINVDDNGIEMLQWLINRHTKYPILYHCKDENRRIAIHEMFEVHWLLQ